MSLYGIYMIVGLFAYYIVYRLDLKEMEVLKRGANINSYSITRLYQLRENINLMKMFSRISIPCACVSAPEFVFYGVFSLIGPGTGLDSTRMFAIALYDAWMPLIAICAIVSVPLCQPQIAKHMPPGMRCSFYIDKTVVYDRGGIPTTIFFVGMESIHLSSTYFAAYRLVHGYVTDMPNLIHNGVYLLGGLVMFSRIALLFGCAMVPEFIFWPTYSLMPEHSELAYIKIAIIAIISVPLCQPQIAKHMPPRLRLTFFAETKLVEQRNVTAETDIYFKQLEANWN
ncbi:hypothetical protein PRIPAC_80301 [Pristionchus pacificus]|uniref:G protein-coupled receptor n=1 Tax=Pristionchus pacificus TaxID=54126 RepID=A0A2A6CLZ9_PRIPA|nr:hypothetical protein PRIPAC_80301 [Pristionchus pacificus]|eukprot:PDM79083.1 G protein-coupled receptor [Pristionchus pacificus]